MVGFSVHIYVSALLNLSKKVLILQGVHQYQQQYQQNVLEPLYSVFFLPSIIKGKFLYQNICFWPSYFEFEQQELKQVSEPLKLFPCQIRIYTLLGYMLVVAKYVHISLHAHYTKHTFLFFQLLYFRNFWGAILRQLIQSGIVTDSLDCLQFGRLRW